MTTKNELLKALPKIDTLASLPDAAANIPLIGRRAVVEICREQVEIAKRSAEKNGVVPDTAAVVRGVLQALKRARSKMLGRVINGTGVLLHTNLGRAPLGAALFLEMADAVSGYCNLEIDVLERRRGIRGEGVSSLLCQVCDAEDAVVVNNNAAALFLTLSALAYGKEVVVSRGELIQIGGGFRIPDILKSAGANLMEVGTTNITTAADYADAITENTAFVLAVHRSNFTMSGFIETPSVADLRAALGPDIPIVADLGSGNLVQDIAGRKVEEPTPKDAMRQGADLVCFSCDKMLGATQGGVIAGKATLILRIKHHPVMRVVRPDKLTFAALQTILSHHLAGDCQQILLWRMAAEDPASLQQRVMTFIDDNDLDRAIFEPCSCESVFGGGSTPEAQIPSFGLCILKPGADEIAARFQSLEPPIVGRIVGDRFFLDFRTLINGDERFLAAACRELMCDEKTDLS